jgi:hypothetical protein
MAIPTGFIRGQVIQLFATGANIPGAPADR